MVVYQKGHERQAAHESFSPYSPDLDTAHFPRSNGRGFLSITNEWLKWANPWGGVRGFEGSRVRTRALSPEPSTLYSTAVPQYTVHSSQYTANSRSAIRPRSPPSWSLFAPSQTRKSYRSTLLPQKSRDWCECWRSHLVR